MTLLLTFGFARRLDFSKWMVRNGLSNFSPSRIKVPMNLRRSSNFELGESYLQNMTERGAIPKSQSHIASGSLLEPRTRRITRPAYCDGRRRGYQNENHRNAPHQSVSFRISC
jgi:hypothetical protein